MASGIFIFNSFNRNLTFRTVANSLYKQGNVVEKITIITDSKDIEEPEFYVIIEDGSLIQRVLDEISDMKIKETDDEIIDPEYRLMIYSQDGEHIYILLSNEQMIMYGKVYSITSDNNLYEFIETEDLDW